MGWGEDGHVDTTVEAATASRRIAAKRLVGGLGLELDRGPGDAELREIVGDGMGLALQGVEGCFSTSS